MTKKLLWLSLLLVACSKDHNQSSVNPVQTVPNGEVAASPSPQPSPIATPIPSPIATPAPSPTPTPITGLPSYNSAWGVRAELYAKAADYYNSHQQEITNRRYLTIVDFRERSSEPRLVVIDLETGAAESHLVSHGSGSDPSNDGYATIFSNVSGSNASSLGFYLTLATYNGEHGFSLRLSGLSDTDSNAEAREIVMHPANYVSESAQHAGRSFGCFAVDPLVSEALVQKLKNGSLILADD